MNRKIQPADSVFVLPGAAGGGMVSGQQVDKQ